MRVPLVDLAAQDAPLIEEALGAIAQVAREGRFVLGPVVDAFERWLAGACTTATAVGVASGTDAIELALRALDVGPGDAVVTPALSFIACAEAIVATGARPVFCDVDPVTLNATERTFADAIVRAQRAGMRVRALVPVHLFGLCAPVSTLGELARTHDVAIVEDAAQALGARDEAGRAAGALGVAGCFSFFPTKNLGAWGDGGAVVTSRPDVAERVRRLRAHGAVRQYVHVEFGRNSRLDAVQAAVLLAKTRRLADWQRARERLAARYREALAGLPLALPEEPPAPAVHAWHAFVVQCDWRARLAEHLRARGVETRVYYPVPLHRQPCFEVLGEPALPHAEAAAERALALPFFAAMSDAQVDYVVSEVTRFFRG